MGLPTLGTGFAPHGIGLVGALSEWLGAARALTVSSLTGLAAAAAADFVRPGSRRAAKLP